MATKKKKGFLNTITKNPLLLLMIVVVVIIIIAIMSNQANASGSTADNTGAPIGATYLLGSLGGDTTPVVNNYGYHTKKKHVSGSGSSSHKSHHHHPFHGSGGGKGSKGHKPGSAHYHGHITKLG